MRALACLCSLIVLAGCASAPPAPPGSQVAAGRLVEGIHPGRTTKGELLAAFGPTKQVRFDSGYEAWVYQSPAGAGKFAEFVILIDPQGVVKKTRQRAPALP